MSSLHRSCPVVNFINVKLANFLYKLHFFDAHVTREKLSKQCSYETFARITLMKLTPDVLFKIRFAISSSFNDCILREKFRYLSFCLSISVSFPQIWECFHNQFFKNCNYLGTEKIIPTISLIIWITNGDFVFLM